MKLVTVIPNGLVMPDSGEAWIGWDWNAIEPRLFANLTQDTTWLGVFERGEDLYLRGTCATFGLPLPPNLIDPHTDTSLAGRTWRNEVQWQGKEDARRVFDKTFELRTIYRGNAREATDIPGVDTLGLTPRKLIQAQTRLLAMHPAWVEWWRVQDAEIVRARCSRTIMGRPRRATSLILSPAGVRAMCRELSNHRIQGSVSDIFNTTALLVKERVPKARFCYGKHDSQWWAIPAEMRDEVWPLVQTIVERPISVPLPTGETQMVVFPATYKERRPE